MKILKIDHIGIAVSDLNQSVDFWVDGLGLTCQFRDHVEDQKVSTAHLEVGESQIELLEATSDQSPIAKFINKKGPGIHHVSLEVDDIEQALIELKQKGIDLIDEKPRIGAGGHKIAFIHPKSASGVLVELYEKLTD